MDQINEDFESPSPGGVWGGPDDEELFERLTIVSAKGQEPLRIDKFLMNRIEGATRNKIQQAIEAERVLVNEKIIKSNYKVRPEDKIVVYDTYLPDSSEIVPENIPFKIVYEDDDVMVVDKEAGMVVHPGSGNPGGTLVNAVAWYLKQQNPSINEDELARFGLVHRIDKNTSGLLVVAKTPKAMTHLAKQFFEHTVHRRYVALKVKEVKVKLAYGLSLELLEEKGRYAPWAYVAAVG